MKQVFSTLILIFFFTCPAFAQNETAPCPTLDVQGDGLFAPESPMAFSAVIGGDTKNLKLEYLWTVSQGKIIEGQGTSSIKVDINELGSVNVTATIEIRGFPANCTNTDSETGSLIIHYRNVLTDEYGRLRDGEMKARMENLFVRLAEEPSSQVYFINYGTEREIAARERQIRRIIRLLKLNEKRVAIVSGGANPRGAGIWTKIWLVPPGAEPPTPDME